MTYTKGFMVVLATGHQDLSIFRVHVAIFNKGIGFFMWIEILCIEYILLRILTTKSMFDVANMWRKYTVKDVSINNYRQTSNIRRTLVRN